jgi:hypothetical protein
LDSALRESLLLLSVIAVFIAMVLSFLSVSFRLYLKSWRKFGVKMFGTGQDITGLYEQNRVLVVGTKVLFYT